MFWNFSVKGRVAKGLITGLTGCSLAVLLWFGGFLDKWEHIAWDRCVSFMAEPGPATDDIRVIFLDQNSLEWAKKENGLVWPWPREIYAGIVNYCKRCGAKALAFDVLYTEPSVYGVSDDVSFVNAVSDYGPVTGAVTLSRSDGPFTKRPSFLPTDRFTVFGLDGWLENTGGTEMTLPSATFPIPELAGAFKVLSNTENKPDKDGIYRRLKPFSIFDGKFFPSLGLGSYLASGKNHRIDVNEGEINIDGRTIPIDNMGNTILRFRGPTGTHLNFSAAAVLQSEIRLLSGEAPVIKDTNAF